MKKPELSPARERQLERQRKAALKRLFRTTEELGEKAIVRIRGTRVHSSFGKRPPRSKSG